VSFNWIKDALAGITPKNNSLVIVRFIRFRLFTVCLRPAKRGVSVLLFVIVHGVASYAKCQTRCTYIRHARYNTLQRRMRKP
jgi:hypothetical protein